MANYLDHSWNHPGIISFTPLHAGSSTNALMNRSSGSIAVISISITSSHDAGKRVGSCPRNTQPLLRKPAISALKWVASASCPHCGAVNVRSGFAELKAFICSECGEGVSIE